MSLKAAALKVLERNRVRNLGATKPANPCNLGATSSTKGCTHDDGKPKIDEALFDACQGLTIAPHEIHEALTSEDLDAWHKGEVSIEELAAFAFSLAQRQEMNQGKRPAHYIQHAICKQCGPVWLWFTGEVLGCPWCWNRKNNRPIPRP